MLLAQGLLQATVTLLRKAVVSSETSLGRRPLLSSARGIPGIHFLNKYRPESSALGWRLSESWPRGLSHLAALHHCVLTIMVTEVPQGEATPLPPDLRSVLQWLLSCSTH